MAQRGSPCACGLQCLAIADGTKVGAMREVCRRYFLYSSISDFGANVPYDAATHDGLDFGRAASLLPCLPTDAPPRATR